MAENGQIRTHWTHWSCFTVGLSDKQFVRLSSLFIVWTIHRFVSRSLIMWDCRMECPAGLVTCGLSTTVTQAHCLLVRPEFYRNKIRPLINDCYHRVWTVRDSEYIFHFNRGNLTSYQGNTPPPTQHLF